MKSHFQWNSDNQLDFPLNEVAYYTPLNKNEYLRLANLYELLYDAKREVDKTRHELAQMEKHIINAMYYNWREEEIQSRSNTTSTKMFSILNFD